MWALAAGAVLVWRVLVPLWRNLRHRLRVTSVVHEADDTVSVYLTGRHLDRLRAEAGQFFGWRFLGRSGWSRGNPYSLSAAPDGRSLRITAKDLGDGSAALRGVRPGTRVLVEGPFGRLSERARTRRKVALVGAGVGVTPLRALAEGLDYAPGEAVLLQRFTDEPLFARELSVLAAERGLEVLMLPGRRRSPDSWLGRARGRWTTSGRCGTGCPTSPSATCTSAAPRRGSRVCAVRPWQQGCPLTTSMSRPSGGDPMRRIVLWILSTTTVVVLLFGYHTSTSGAMASSDVVARAAPTPGTGASASASGVRAPAPRRARAPARPPRRQQQVQQDGRQEDRHRTDRADPAGARSRSRSPWSPGRSPTSPSCEYPYGNPKDQEINAYALPVLVKEAIDAQSAEIDMVSGATVTSVGYLSSLQSALDKAGL